MVKVIFKEFIYVNVMSLKGKCVSVCAHVATYLMHWHAGSHGGHTSPGSPPAGRVGACLHSRMEGHAHAYTNTDTHTYTHTEK